MARITRVKSAQQRYKTIPVIDPETGEPKKTPVMKRSKDRETGEITEVQKTTKTGRPVFMKVTVQDKTQPLPNLKCDFPGCDIDGGEILPGTPYQHVTPKSGVYGGTQRNRHAQHPSWQPWDLSNTLTAQLARIAHDFTEAVGSAESTDDVQSALDDAAASITEIAEAKKEAASNIEDGFGHPTEKSEELEEIADALESWASEVESADIPELPEPEERYFIENNIGTRYGEEGGYDTEEDAQSALDEMAEDLLDGDADDYEIVADTLDDPSEDQLNDWRDQVRDEVTIVDEAPV